MQETRIDEHACAVLALNTRLAWTEEYPQPLARAVVRRMIETGVVQGLVLRDVPGIDHSALERARRLLGRVGDVYAGMMAYRDAGFRLLFPGRSGWPNSLGVLGMKMPLFLFARGNLSLLGGRLIAVAGSRQILPETQCAAAETGRRIAQAGMVLITGGAQGVDSDAMRAALDAGGSGIIVPAVPVSQLLLQPHLVQALAQGRLLVLCDTLPDEPFSAAKALGRNHTIYALGSAALVTASRDGVGGSWHGAADCLRGNWRPVCVWDGDNADTRGNQALLKLGARTYSLQKALSEQVFAPEQTCLPV